jgi:nucleoside 2-deoxyribosyltransferase
MKIKSLYIIGSLRNPEIPKFANEIQELGIEGFADWFSPGPTADDCWKEYSKARELTYGQALQSYAATHVFEFDHSHLKRCDGAVLLMPAGKSAFLELGYTIGKGKPGWIVYEEEPEDRWDVMFQFATGIFFSRQEFLEHLK